MRSDFQEPATNNTDNIQFVTAAGGVSVRVTQHNMARLDKTFGRLAVHSDNTFCLQSGQCLKVDRNIFYMTCQVRTSCPRRSGFHLGVVTGHREFMTLYYYNYENEKFCKPVHDKDQN